MCVLLRRFAATAFVVGLTLGLSACGGGGSPSSTSTAILPAQSSQASTRTASITSPSAVTSPSIVRAESAPATAAAAPNPCTIVPVKNVEVSTPSLTMAPNGSAQFQACTQYSGPFTITASPKGIVSFVSPVNVTVLPNTIKVATITLTAGAKDGTTTLTITDKKGLSAHVTVTVVGTLSLSCPGFGIAGGSAVACTVTNPGYVGAYTFTSSTNTCTATLNGFTVSDTVAEGCKVTLTPTSGSQSAIQVTIQFVGPLSLNCPNSGLAGATGVSCSVTNPNYSGGYNGASTSSGTCSAGALSNGTFTLTDSTGESCTVTITPSSGPESAVQATVAFVGPLTLNCPQNAAIGATGASCTYSNPAYSGDYKFTATAGGCTLAAGTDTTLTVTDSTAQDCTFTFTPLSGSEGAAQATIHFEGPLTLNCPSAGTTGDTGVACTYSDAGYSDAFATSIVSGSCSAPATPTGGTFTVTDSTAESCTVKLTATNDGGLSTPQTATITFSAPSASGIGPLSLNCPSTMVFVNGTPAICSFTNPGYPSTDGYTASATNGCQTTTQPGNGASGNFAVQATAVPTNCQVTLTPTSTTANEQPVQATITFVSGGGGGGGGGCSVIKHGKKNNTVTPYLVRC